MFSFSPDNDSRQCWAVSGRAHPCRAALPRARTRPQSRRQSWPQPMHVASGAMQHPGCIPSPCQVPAGHRPHWPLCLSSPGLARPPDPGLVAPQHLSWSQSCAGGCPHGFPCRVAPLVPWAQPGGELCTLLGSGASPYRVPLHSQTIPPAALPACPCPALFLAIWQDPISPLLVQAGYQGPGRLPGPGAAVWCGQQDCQPLSCHKQDQAAASLGPQYPQPCGALRAAQLPPAAGRAAVPSALGSQAGRTSGDCCRSICKPRAP